MATKSSIEWTEMTWNPVTGCTKVSEGCRHGYAERMALRLRAMGNRRYVGGFDVTLHDDLVDLPRKLRQPRVIFVNSMSDLFHEDVPGRLAEECLDRRQRGGSASPRPHRRSPRGSGFGAVLVVRTALGPDARFGP